MANDQPILIYYDGWCSFCQRSARQFRKYDRDRGIVRCVDFRTDPGATETAGVSIETLSNSLHAKFPSGELLSGPEAIRRVLHALGRGSLAAWTRWPIIRPIVDWCYKRFAKHRLRLFSTHSCDDGACTVRPRGSQD